MSSIRAVHRDMRIVFRQGLVAGWTAAVHGRMDRAHFSFTDDNRRMSRSFLISCFDGAMHQAVQDLRELSRSRPIPVASVLTEAPDLPAALNGAVPLARLVTSGSAKDVFALQWPEQRLETDADVVDAFLQCWLPQYVGLCDALDPQSKWSLSMVTVAMAVESFSRFFTGTTLGSSPSAFVQHPMPFCWSPRKPTERRIHSRFAQWLGGAPPSALDALRSSTVVLGCPGGSTADVILRCGGAQRLMCVHHNAAVVAGTELLLSDWKVQFAKRRSNAVSTMVVHAAGIPKRPTGLTRGGLNGESLVGSRSTRIDTRESSPGREAVGQTALQAASARRKRRWTKGTTSERATASPDSRGSTDDFPVDFLCVPCLPVSLPDSPVDVLLADQAHAASASLSHEGLVSLLESLVAGAEGTSVLPLDRSVFVALTLPVVFSPFSFSPSSSTGPSPVDVVKAFVARNDGRVVVHPHSTRVMPFRARGLSSSGEERGGSETVAPELCTFQAMLPPRSHGLPLLDAAEAWLEQRAMVDFVLLEIVPASQRTTTTTSRRTKRTGLLQEDAAALPWRSTVEYQHFLPSDGLPNPFHYTEQMPSFDYLELDDASQSAATSQSSVAAGRQTSRSVAQPPSPDAHARFRSVFAHELQRGLSPRIRPSKAQKLAFATKEKVDWFLDEKVVKSEQARVEALNDILRRMGTLKDPE